jgi:hypothetical protein
MSETLQKMRQLQALGYTLETLTALMLDIEATLSEHNTQYAFDLTQAPAYTQSACRLLQTRWDELKSWRDAFKAHADDEQNDADDKMGLIRTVFQPLSKSLWQKEHPGALDDVDPTFLAYFCDTSYHNDECPSFIFYLTATHGLHLWADYLDESDRENAGVHRFSLRKMCRIGDDGVDISDPDSFTLYDGDNIDDLKAAFNSIVNKEAITNAKSRQSSKRPSL